MSRFSLPADYYDPPEPTLDEVLQDAIEFTECSLGELDDLEICLEDAIYFASQIKYRPAMEATRALNNAWDLYEKLTLAVVDARNCLLEQQEDNI